MLSSDLLSGCKGCGILSYILSYSITSYYFYCDCHYYAGHILHCLMTTGQPRDRPRYLVRGECNLQLFSRTSQAYSSVWFGAF